MNQTSTKDIFLTISWNEVKLKSLENKQEDERNGAKETKIKTSLKHVKKKNQAKYRINQVYMEGPINLKKKIKENVVPTIEISPYFPSKWGMTMHNKSKIIWSPLLLLLL